MTLKGFFVDVEKTCVGCRKRFPENLEHFKVHRRNPSTGAIQFRARCRGCFKEQRKLWPSRQLSRKKEKAVYKKEHPEEKRFYKLKASARKRGLQFSLTKEDVKSLMLSSCYYCGDDPPVLSVDRVDNDFGYTPLNVVAACKECNAGKLQSPYEEFVVRCGQIWQRHKGLLPESYKTAVTHF